MTKSVETETLFKFPLERVKAAVYRHCCPGFVAAVSEESSTAITTQPALSDLDGGIVEVNDAVPFAAFRFLGWKHPTAVLNVDVPMFDAQDFLRSRTGLPRDLENVAKCSVSRGLDQCFEFGRCDNEVAFAGRRLLEVLDWRSVDIALLDGPIQGPLDRTAGVTLVTRRPALLRINPALQM